ncbi:hypothetical protein C807_00764 [Lachnospiraceae bacterium 28-4]|nr:hypothetical protein C807_00764 [Lachnospiraceae bacterium 28-4]
MADVKPFKAIRPKEGLEQRIAALPYDVYSREEAKREVEREPLSFLRVDRAETQFTDDVDAYADMVYEKARDLLWEMVTNGELVEETGECYYVYELVMDGRSQTGIAACSSVDDYLHQVIRKHENTREDKEIDRIRHVDVCKAQTGPIFLAYRSHPVIQEEMERTRKDRALYDFTASDGIIHRIWKIEETGAVERIRKAFQEVGRIYIADGHHRCASAVKVSLKRREADPGNTGKEEFNYFLSVLFPDDQLMIMDYNRVVKDLNGLEKGELIRRISESFLVEKADQGPYRPEEKGCFGMYLEDGWYRLRVKEMPEKKKEEEHPEKWLDVAILQDRLLAPVLGIQDPKTDKRIDFVGGIRGLEELERRVHTDAAVAFSMCPTSVAELFAVADAGQLMPPKSTWFEPKLRSGLLIHRI